MLCKQEKLSLADKVYQTELSQQITMERNIAPMMDGSEQQPENSLIRWKAYHMEATGG